MPQNASNEQERLLLELVKKGPVEELHKVLAAHTYTNWRMAKAWSDAYVESVNLEAIKILSKFVNPKRGNSDALVGCARHGHLEAVQFLIPISDPANGKSRALRAAAKNGHLHIVEALLPYAPTEDLLAAISDIASHWGVRQTWSAMRNEEFPGAGMEDVLLHLMRHVGFNAMASSFKQTSASKKDAQHYDELMRIMLDCGKIKIDEIAPLFENADMGECMTRCRVDWDRFNLAKQTGSVAQVNRSKRL